MKERTVEIEKVVRKCVEETLNAAELLYTFLAVFANKIATLQRLKSVERSVSSLQNSPVNATYKPKQVDQASLP
jgi:hypothetical protein